jgi:MFS family permease
MSGHARTTAVNSKAVDAITARDLPPSSPLTYLGELRVNWRCLAAASVGLASGFTLLLYFSNIFAPHLIQEFGWSRSQFALLGLSILVAIVTLPIMGRLADILGVRRMVAIGITLTPLLLIAFSRINGNFAYFFFLNVLQIIVGAITTSLVYGRLIAENFRRSRGLAFGIAACAAPATAAVATRILSSFITVHGWRAGYLVLAAGTAVGGLVALLLIPSRSPTIAKTERRRKRTSRDYAEIVRNPAFRWIALGMLLCNLTLIVQSSQLKLILLDRGVTSEVATMMLSVYPIGIVFGRLCCGLALDRFPTYIISALALGFPCIGLFIIALGSRDTVLVGAAVAIIGLSMGAELDVLSFLVMRFFRVEIYSSVFGLTQPVCSLSAALGSLLLSATLKMTGGFTVFLYLSALATLVGSASFLMLKKVSRPDSN